MRAVDDGATVRIYYEGRLAKLDLAESERPKLDPEFEEVTEGAEESVKAELKSKWARLEAMVGGEKRIRLIGQDIVEHFEKRYEALGGKGVQEPPPLRGLVHRDRQPAPRMGVRRRRAGRAESGDDGQRRRPR